jgi:tRNA pseudouridine55 synthase
MTSFGVVARIRRVLSRQIGKKAKVGHTGTLDPFATGLMILVTGTECRNAGIYTKHDKVYEATFVLGQVSTTGDPEGDIVDYSRPESAPAKEKRLRAGSQIGHAPIETQAADVSLQQEPHGPTLDQIHAALAQFTGEIIQRPPIFSAIKIAGRRAYDLAREGKNVEMPERTVAVYSLELIDYAYPELRVRAHVSSGTYIRSLAVDIGEALGTGAYCSQLRRTKIADYDVKDAKKPEDLGVRD